MTQYVPVTIDNRELINSFHFVFKVGSKIVVYPFPEEAGWKDDNKFRLIIDIKIEEETGPPKTSLYQSNEPEIGGELHITRGFNRGKQSSNIGSINFASDEKYEYYIGYTINLLGKYEDAAASMQIFVTREAV